MSEQKIRQGVQVVCIQTSIISLPLYEGRFSRKIKGNHTDVILSAKTIKEAWDSSEKRTKKPNVPVLTVRSISGDFISFYSSENVDESRKRMFFHPISKFKTITEYGEV